MKKLLLFLSLTIAFMFVSCGGSCLPGKNIGDVIIVNQQTFGAMDRASYNKMMDAARAGDNAATTDMILAGQLRFVLKGTRATLKEKDGTRALLLLPDDNREWWLNENFLE